MKVAVAIITDEQQRILITQRPSHVSQGGCWEFPGGKLELNELAEDALIREIKEEVGLIVHECNYLGQVTYQYPEKLVELIIFHVTAFTGTPVCREGQLSMQWAYRSDLQPERFPAANRSIFNLIPVVNTP